MDSITNVTTGKARLSFVHLFKPCAFTPGQEEKFSCTILVPKFDMDTMARINTAIEAAKQRGVTDKWGGVQPPMIPIPVYDGDGVRPSDGMEFGPECKGHWVFTASDKADYPPEVVDKQGNPIINQSEVYSGMFGEHICIRGTFRSFNKHEEFETKLALHVFAEEVSEIKEDDIPLEEVNNISLDGYICKIPIYRVTPLGREIADILLAVNRQYGKSDYIPCVVWGVMQDLQKI